MGNSTTKNVPSPPRSGEPTNEKRSAMDGPIKPAHIQTGKRGADLQSPRTHVNPRKTSHHTRIHEDDRKYQRPTKIRRLKSPVSIDPGTPSAAGPHGHFSNSPDDWSSIGASSIADTAMTVISAGSGESLHTVEFRLPYTDFAYHESHDHKTGDEDEPSRESITAIQPVPMGMAAPSTSRGSGALQLQQGSASSIPSTLAFTPASSVGSRNRGSRGGSHTHGPSPGGPGHNTLHTPDAMNDPSMAMGKDESSQDERRLSAIDFEAKYPLLSDDDWVKIKKISKISDEFKIHRKLGKGVSSVVYLVTKRADSSEKRQKKYALKQIQSNKHADVLFLTEYKFLSKLHLPGVIKIHSAYVDPRHLYILSEYACIDLFTRIKKRDRLSERKSKKIIKKLFETVAILHQHNVVHRDIKPENIVFKKTSPLQPKLIDWADALVVESDLNEYTELCGTAVYLSPERWRRHTGWELKRSDVWSCGITCFECVTGKRAFFGASTTEIQRRIEDNEWHFYRSTPISESCMDFIRKSLAHNAADRWSAKDALRHPWLHA